MASTVLRSIRRIVEAREQAEGAGARVRRAIGNNQLRNLDPFLMLDEFMVKPPAGFPEHPHRGFQTVTYMLDGSFEHRDHTGSHGVIKSGGVQWMTAGRGVIHSEMPAEDKVNTGLQLWVNLAAKHKMIPANYQDIPPEKIPEVERDGVKVRIIAGEAFGVKSPIFTHTPAVYYDVTLQPGTTFVQPIDPGFNGFVYVLEGQVDVGKDATPLPRGHLGVLNTDGDAVRVSVKEGQTRARVALVAGQPLNEPVVQYGPFVMNTQAEIQQAFMDYQSGKLTGDE